MVGYVVNLDLLKRGGCNGGGVENWNFGGVIGLRVCVDDMEIGDGWGRLCGGCDEWIWGLCICVLILVVMVKFFI